MTTEEQKAIDAVFMEFGGRTTNRTIYEERMAQTIVGQRRALAIISEGRGRFSRDPLTHADNTIEDMKAHAAKALVGDYPEWSDD
jgi:hypothetical protein